MTASGALFGDDEDLFGKMHRQFLSYIHKEDTDVEENY